MKKYLILGFIAFISCNDKVGDGRDIICEDCLIIKEETALGVALPILYENYGEDKIKSERPYMVSVEQDSIWNIRGTFNRIGFGGVFNIKISAKNGRVIEMYHEK